VIKNEFSTSHAMNEVLKESTQVVDFLSNITAQWLPLFTTVKGKGVPLQAWTGPEASRRLRLADI
jgi:hypothetical protein